MTTSTNRIKGFQPHCFIRSGATNAMYTLRITCLKYIPGPGPMGNAVVNGVYQGDVVRSSEYVCNLSTDLEIAKQKAEAYCKANGLQLSTRDPEGDLREIIRSAAADRRTPEQIAEEKVFDEAARQAAAARP